MTCRRPASPTRLRSQVATSDDLLLTPTEVIYRDDTPAVAGIAVGSGLTLPGTGRYEIYFIFPLTQQMNILAVLQTAVVSTGAILVVLLTFIAALVARQVVVPIRAARRAAESLASGNLDDRMKVRGRDDLARLAISMNYMASELQKQISQLEELSRVQQRFVSDVSHELRTPLTTVRMAAEVLYETREDFDPIAARSAELLQNELDRFEALLTDLLEISRFDAGAAVLAVSEVDLRDVVHRVVIASEQLARTSGSEIRVHAPHPGFAEVDSRRIERVLRNLLVNAIEHGEGRPIDILVESDDHAVAVAVRDHGVGFEAGQAKQVFHRFWRADPARARTVGGTGLGLAISMEDANLHKGWLTAWGRPGMGAQFRLTVPRLAGGVIESSPLPLVPRDLVLPAVPIEAGTVVTPPLEPVVVPTEIAPTSSTSSPSDAAAGATPMRRTPFLLVVVFLLLALITGCVSVPTAGPVEKVEGQPPECQNCINVDVAPPSAGDEPKQIVQGFLRATSNFQPNYAVARQFLTTGAAEKWAPESGVSIYSGSIQAAGTTVILDGRLVGSLGPDRTYTAQDKAWRVNFGMVKENGEWRISTPPAGLMVAEFAFSSFYQSYNLYFVGNGTALVPNPIYLPNLRNQASIASVLMRALLSGPSEWLAPAVTSAIPEGTALSVDAVTINDGVAEVALSDNVLSLNDGQRTLMAAQVLYTLQPTGIQGVTFTVNQQPYAIPGADQGTYEVALDSRFAAFDPIPPGIEDAVYTARDDKVSVLASLTDPSQTIPVPGPLGAGRWPIDQLAVSATGSDVAAVTDGGRVLRRAEVADGTVRTVLAEATDLLRPEFTRFAELWAVGDQGGRQRLWVERDGRVAEIDSTILSRGEITAFAISPDGVRMALIREVDGRTELGLARIVRGERVRLDGWQPLDVTRSTTPDLSLMRDLAWSDATSLAVLGGASGDAPLTVYRVSQDASSITAVGEPIAWDARSLTVLLKSQTVVVLDSSGQTWRDGSTQWLTLLDKVDAVAAPG